MPYSNSFIWQTAMAPLDREKQEWLDKFVWGKSVLDVGCATGVYAEYLANSGYEVTGWDINKELIDLANQRKSKASFKNKDFLNNEIEKKYDTVLAMDVLEHVNEDIGLKKLIKLTNKRIVLSMPRTTDKGLQELYLLYGHHLDTSHLRTYTEEDIEIIASKYKLKPVSIKASHALATEALALEIWEGNLILRKINRRLLSWFLKPKKYYTNLLVVLDKKGL
jgi:SAM-dependent methyltransferase